MFLDDRETRQSSKLEVQPDSSAAGIPIVQNADSLQDNTEMVHGVQDIIPQSELDTSFMYEYEVVTESGPGMIAFTHNNQIICKHFNLFGQS